MMTNDDERGEGGKKYPKFDDVICERPLSLFLVGAWTVSAPYWHK